jgi:hypothetical protein
MDNTFTERYQEKRKQDEDPLQKMIFLLSKAFESKRITTQHIAFQSFLLFLGNIMMERLPSSWFNNLLQFGLLLLNKYGQSLIQLLCGKEGSHDPCDHNFGMVSLRTLQRHRVESNTYDGVELRFLLNYLETKHHTMCRTDLKVELIPSVLSVDGMQIQPGVCTDISAGKNFGYAGMAIDILQWEAMVTENKPRGDLIEVMTVVGLSSMGPDKPVFGVIGKEGNSRNLCVLLKEYISVCSCCLDCLKKVFNFPKPGDIEIKTDTFGKCIGHQQGWTKRAMEICVHKGDTACSRCIRKGIICRRVEILVCSSDAGAGQMSAIWRNETKPYLVPDLYVVISLLISRYCEEG